MKNINIKSKSSQLLCIILGLLMLSACHSDNRRSLSNEVNAEAEHTVMDARLLLGSWKDTSASALHFTLFENGTAQSDNMQTLLYKHWEMAGDQISFIIESIGNGTSFTDTVTYTIEELTEHRLLLRKGTQLSAYTKE